MIASEKFETVSEAGGKGAMVWILYSRLKVIRQRPVFRLYNTTGERMMPLNLFPIVPAP